MAHFSVEIKDGPKAKWKSVDRMGHQTLESAVKKARSLDQDGLIPGNIRIKNDNLVVAPAVYAKMCLEDYI